jgi:hypothetical protein
LVTVEVEAWCEAVLLGRFLDEEELLTGVAKAGAMTRGEGTWEEEVEEEP